MGHEDQTLDEFVEAHKTYLNDLMYFPTHNAYGLSSVAGEWERRWMVIKLKAESLENKVKVLTHG